MVTGLKLEYHIAESPSSRISKICRCSSTPGSEPTYEYLVFGSSVLLTMCTLCWQIISLQSMCPMVRRTLSIISKWQRL
jgi:hypothetical protein